MRTQRDLLRARALELEPGIDDVLREHAAALQEFLVRLQRVERLLERARGVLHVLALGRVELVDVDVHRSGRLDLVLHAVEAGHEARREREVRVARRIG